MKLDKVTKQILEQISGLHEMPSGAVSFRKNGKTQVINSTKNIEIFKKENGLGIDVVVHSTCKGEVCHLPVVVDEADLFDLAYNDFYIEDDADVTIVAGCGVHSGTQAGHDGIHTFHIGKNAKVRYLENHLALGKGENKVLSPTTVMKIGENSVVEMKTVQLGGVDYSNRKTKAELKDGATLNVDEKILTDGMNEARTDFVVTLKGKDSKCNIVSRSVAKDESLQSFKSNVIGKNLCFGHVECDAIVLDKAIVNATPNVKAMSSLASLSHEAAIGKIAGEQILKLMTLGLTEKQAEEKIIEGFLK